MRSCEAVADAQDWQLAAQESAKTATKEARSELEAWRAERLGVLSKKLCSDELLLRPLVEWHKELPREATWEEVVSFFEKNTVDEKLMRQLFKSMSECLGELKSLGVSLSDEDSRVAEECSTLLTMCQVRLTEMILYSTVKNTADGSKRKSLLKNVFRDVAKNHLDATSLHPAILSTAQAATR